MLGYLKGREVGAILYNASHTYSIAIANCLVFCIATQSSPSPLWLIWPAHITFDRMLGYGLKFPTSFHLKHLS